MRAVLLGGAMLGLVAALPVRAQEQAGETVLAPMGEWQLNRAKDKCRLKRVFGQGDTKVELFLDQAGAEPFYTVSLFGKPLRSFRGSTMSIQFGPDEAAMERSFVYGRLGDADRTPYRMMYGVNLAPPQPVADDAFASAELSEERKARITRIVLDLGGRTIVLPTGSLGEPLAQVQGCADALVEAMGIGRTELVSRAQPINLADIASKIVYPSELTRAGVEGRVQFRLTVSPRGVPTTCQIAHSTRPQTFDDVVCLALLRELRFRPALDGQGEPAFDVYSSRVVFWLDRS